MKRVFIVSLCLLTSVFAQYSREYNINGGGDAQMDIDNDGLYELAINNSNGLTFLNSDYSTYWTIPHFQNYGLYAYAIPRDINGDGLVTPVNTDNDAAGELVISYYYFAPPPFISKIRIYDVVTHILEWDSPYISGYCYPYVEDLDGDNKAEIIIHRFENSYDSVEVYSYSGGGIEENQYTKRFSVSTLPNPIQASAFPKGQFPVYDILGRVKNGPDIQKGIYFLDYEGKKIKVIVE